MRIQISWLLRILLLKDLTQNPVDDTPIKVVSKTAPDFEVRRSQSGLGESNEDAEKKPTSQARLRSSWYTTQFLPHP